MNRVNAKVRDLYVFPLLSCYEYVKLIIMDFHLYFKYMYLANNCMKHLLPTTFTFEQYNRAYDKI